MVCVTSSTSSTINFNSNFEIIKDKMSTNKKFEDDYMDDEDDISDNSSQEDEKPTRQINQPLFLNFTSDLCPQKSNKKKSKQKKQTAYRVNGVNILNRNNLDSKTAIERIQRRRENHNHVERRRRDNINNIIFELSSVVPNAVQPGQKPNKGNILKLSLDYIKELQAENKALKECLDINNIQYASSSTTLPSINTSPNHHNHHAIVDSPSVPNSPHYLYNTLPKSVSLPSSPIHSTTNSLPPPPLNLPPPQTILSNASSSTTASTGSSSTVTTPTLSSTSSPQPISQHFVPTSFYIPQPPLLDHNRLYNKSTMPQNLRPLLPATTPSTQLLPSIRMSGYEKIYGNVCRY